MVSQNMLRCTDLFLYKMLVTKTINLAGTYTGTDQIAIRHVESVSNGGTFSTLSELLFTQ